ncbi:MAG: antibiotic biosynthesis monooxygenase [Bacteroidetes bacterium]|nr:MAG: antibiotic biosynthesis monooxygenase [Bacteroidota bacterium]
MFAVIYAFHVQPGQAGAFEIAWRELTMLIYQYEGSLGSRLHRQDEATYIAYAQWPDRQTWAQSGDKLPPEAKEASARMRAACTQIETLYELDSIDDLLQPQLSQG